MIWAFAVKVLGLIISLCGEFFAARKRAKEADTAFEVNQKTFREMVAAVIGRQHEEAAAVSSGSGAAWDAADQDRGKDDKISPTGT